MTPESFQNDLQIAQNLVYKESGFMLKNLVLNSESTNMAIVLLN